MRCHPKHVDSAGSHLEYEQHVQPLQEDGVHGEAVHRQHALGLCPEELPPGQCRPLGRRFDAGPVEDGPYGAGPDPALVPEPAQLTVDATVAPGRVLPCQPQHQIADLQRHAWTTTPVWVAPAPSHQILMPAQQRLGPDEQPVPARARQQPGESGQHRTVSPVQSGSDHLPAEHRNLVPQHQQLHVVGRRAPCQQHQPSQQLAEHQIEQSKRHLSIIGASVSLSEVAAQSLRPTFWHPQDHRHGRAVRPFLASCHEESLHFAGLPRHIPAQCNSASPST
jgi:hypothetical protein